MAALILVGAVVSEQSWLKGSYGRRSKRIRMKLSITTGIKIRRPFYFVGLVFFLVSGLTMLYSANGYI
jgi:hypothetical protein